MKDKSDHSDLFDNGTLTNIRNSHELIRYYNEKKKYNIKEESNNKKEQKIRLIRT